MANETTSTPVAAQNAAVQTQPAAETAHGATATAGEAHGATYNPKMPEPQMLNGVKVYPTSYIPAKAQLHYPKPMLIEMKDWHIEVVHIVVFFLVLFILFIGAWKRPNHR